jgi:long-chain acyl-CoA synthetase
MLSHGNLLTSALGCAKACDFFDHYIYLHTAPMFHISDANMILVVTSGCRPHAFIERFTPGDTLKAIEKHKVTDVTLVPTMLAAVLDHEDFDDFDLASLEDIEYAASPIPEQTLRRALSAFPNVRFTQGYGLTETAPLATVLEPLDHDPDGPRSHLLRSAGRAAAHCEIRVADSFGAEAPLGTVGEVQIRGGNVMLGYKGLPELTEETIVDGWFKSGDAGRMDDEGYLFIVDRIKDVIISGGENVYSAEVENAIMSSGKVAQCAVIGRSDEKWGEIVCAVLVPRDGVEVTEQEIIDHCHSLIAGYKCPKVVEVRTDPLPVSGAGKVLKREL